MQFTLCRQFMSSALQVVRLAAVLQRCDVIEWCAQKILCKQELLTFFFFFFSILRKLWSRLLCGEDSSRSAVGTNSHVQYHWNPRLPHSDLLFLSAVLFRVWPEPIVCLPHLAHIWPGSSNLSYLRPSHSLSFLLSLIFSKSSSPRLQAQIHWVAVCVNKQPGGR